MLDYKTPWLFQDNDYKPASNALKYLRKIGTSDEFIGAFKLADDDLAEFTSHLFWIIRCNASLPYCWFTTSGHKFVGTICKYGNFHFETYSKKIKQIIENFAKEQSLIQIENCLEGFSVNGIIDGRRIDVN